MQRYEFKVVPAPRRADKARGVKTTEERFALTLTGLMNELGAEGWDYVRADALPCDERSGLTGTKTSYQNMLVFRRPLAESQTPVLRATEAFPEAKEPLPAPKVVGAAEAPAGPAPALGPAS